MVRKPYSASYFISFFQINEVYIFIFINTESLIIMSINTGCFQVYILDYRK